MLIAVCSVVLAYPRAPAIWGVGVMVVSISSRARLLPRRKDFTNTTNTQKYLTNTAKCLVTCKFYLFFCYSRQIRKTYFSKILVLLTLNERPASNTCRVVIFICRVVEFFCRAVEFFCRVVELLGCAIDFLGAPNIFSVKSVKILKLVSAAFCRKIVEPPVAIGFSGNFGFRVGCQWC